MGRSKKGKKRQVEKDTAGQLREERNRAGEYQLEESTLDLRQSAERALLNAVERGTVSSVSEETLKAAWRELYLSCREMANQGDLGALSVMGECYAVGIEGYFEKDYKRAAEHFEAAAKKGHAPAQNSVGVLYALGLGVKKDLTIAKSWFERAAAEGDKKAAVNLGNILQYHGSKNEHDLRTAAELYENAAIGNDAKAQYHLGLALLEGAGTGQNLNMGVSYIQMAAQKNNPEAEATLGMCYQYGLVVPQNLRKALLLYKRAALKGCQKAEEKARELEVQGIMMNADEISGKDRAPARCNQSLTADDRVNAPSLSIHLCCYLLDHFGLRNKIKDLLLRSQSKSLLSYKSLQSALVGEIGLSDEEGQKLEDTAVLYRSKGFDNIVRGCERYPFYADPSYLRYSLHGQRVLVENVEVQRRRPSSMWYERDVLLDFEQMVGRYLYMSELDSERKDFKSSLATILSSKIKKLPSIRHSNLVPVSAVIDRTGCAPNPCIVVVCSQWSYGTLYSLLRHVNYDDHLDLSLRERLRLALDISRGIEHCHSHGIIHGDLSTENILIRSRTEVDGPDYPLVRYTAGVSEFGLDPLSQLRHPAEAQRVLLGSSLAWLAPERLLGELKSTGPTLAVDMWSLGLIIWELWTGEKPWREVRSVLDLVNRVMECDERPEMPPQEGYEEDEEYIERPFYEMLCDMIKKCWSRKPKERPSAAAVSSTLERVLDNLQRFKESREEG